LIIEASGPVDVGHIQGCAYPEALAVMAGRNPGWVFINDEHSPRAALVWASGTEGFYLVGDPSCAVFVDGLRELFDSVLDARLRSLGVGWCEVGGDEGWDPVIKGVLANRTVSTSCQLVYTLEHSPSVDGEEPHDVRHREVVEMRREAVEGLTGRGAGFVARKLDRFWGDRESFYAGGIGYMYVLEGEAVSVCFSGFVTEATHAIDIETEEAYRERGFAESVGRAFVARGLGRGLRLHWDCMGDNVASFRLAERLGFKRVGQYTLFSYRL
jgi:RimJ/RimL family protein N-acetyltransferase